MKKKSVVKFPGPRLRSLAAGGVSLAAIFAAAAAQQFQNAEPQLELRTDNFGYAFAVSPRVSYSDNINLAQDGQEDDEIILSTALSGGAIAATRRVTALLLADVDFSYLTEQSDLVINQRVGATSTVIGVDDWLYFDLGGQTSRQLIGDNARFSGNVNAGRNQRTDVHSVAGSPYLFRQLPNQSSTELRYRYSQVFVDENEVAGGFLGAGGLSDSRSHEALANYQSGALLDRVRFGVNLYANDTEEDGGPILPNTGFQQGSANGIVEYALTRRFSLSGAAGYDNVDVDGFSSLFFNNQDLSGVFWRAGFTARPNRRSTVRIEYGQRFGDDFIDADVDYAITQRLGFSAGARRTLQTRSQSVANQLQTRRTATLEFANRLREGGAASPRGLIESASQFDQSFAGRQAQSTGVAVSENAFANLFGRYGRTTLSLAGDYNDSNFGFRDVQTVAARLRGDRQLSRLLDVNASLEYRRADTAIDIDQCVASPFVFGVGSDDSLFDPETACLNLAQQEGVTTTVIGRVGARYSIYENVAAFAQFSHTERFSENGFNEFSENAATIGLTVNF